MPYLLILILLMSLLTGCTPSGKKQASPSRDNNEIKVKQTEDQAARPLNRSNAQTAAHLEQIAESVPQVGNARCIVFGNTAVVGIDVKGQLDRSRVGTLKYTVAQALRKDPYGKNALVTADIDLNHRLSELKAEMQKGKPIAGFAQEMADIIGRIMPQLPQQVEPKNPAGETESNKLKNRSL